VEKPVPRLATYDDWNWDILILDTWMSYKLGVASHAPDFKLDGI
jgi:hypothetical protein